MLTRKISGHILTIGCEYRHPKGGVAQVMYNYEKYVFPVFNCIVNSGGTNNVAKLLKAISGYLLMAIHLTTDSHLRIVHIHTSSYNSFKRSAYFVRLAKAFGRKVVLHIHGGDFKKLLRYKPEMDCFRVESVWHDCYLVRIMEKVTFRPLLMVLKYASWRISWHLPKKDVSCGTMVNAICFF